METFSTNELRIKLFDKLTASGVSEKIKFDLFDLVATEIQAMYAQLRLGALRPKSDTLLHRVIDSPFIEYLSHRGLEFTNPYSSPKLDMKYGQ
jgi:hypothetical protein